MTRGDPGVGTARGLDRLEGNRIWRVTTPRGTVLQKYYAERGGWAHVVLKDLVARVHRCKTGSRAAARRRTEARMLALWTAVGLDVPRELSGDHPHLANERTLVLEDVPGPLLSQALVHRTAPPARRRELLTAFARQWCRRHRLALERGEAGLIHEHGSLQHLIVSGDRLVTIDLENAFLARPDLLPIVAKEIAGVLVSLARIAGPGGARTAEFRGDLEILVGAYEDVERLAAAARHYLHHPSAIWRMTWRADRWRERRRGKSGKFEALEVLADVLRRRTASSPAAT